MYRTEQYIGDDPIPIEEIDLPLDYSSPRIARVLAGLQFLWVDDDSSASLRSIVSAYPISASWNEEGRPHMPLWRVLVLSVLKVSLNLADEDLLYHANDLRSLRLLLGYAPSDPFRYDFQTIVNMVTVLPQQAQEEIAQLAVDEGQRLAGKVRSWRIGKR